MCRSNSSKRASRLPAFPREQLGTPLILGGSCERDWKFYAGVILYYLVSVMRRSESWRDWLVLKFLTRRRSLPYISSEKRSALATLWGSMSVPARISITENAGLRTRSSSLQQSSEATFWIFRVLRITFIYCSGHGQTSLRLGTTPKLQSVGGSCVRPGKLNWKSMKNGSKRQPPRRNSI